MVSATSAGQQQQQVIGFSSRAAVFLAGFCAFVSVYCTQPLLPLFIDLFHATKAQVGLTVSITTMAVAIAAPIVGLFADLIGRKRIIVPATFAVAIPMLLAGTAHSLPQLLAYRFLQGLFLPGIFAVTIAYVTEEFAHVGVGRMMSIYVSGTVLGGFSGRMVAGLCASYLGWRASFYTLGLLMVLGGSAMWLWLPASTHFVRQTFSRDSAARRYAPLFRIPPLLATYLIGSSVLFSLVSTFTYITFYLAAPPFSLSPAALSLLFLVYLIGVVITPVAGVWLDRAGVRPATMLALAGGALGILLTLVPSLPAILAGLALCSSGVFVCQSAATSYLRIVAPAGTRSAAAGLYLSCYYLGGTIGGLLPSLMWKWGGWPACAALIAGVQGLTILMVWRWWGPVNTAATEAKMKEASPVVPAPVE